MASRATIDRFLACRRRFHGFRRFLMRLTGRLES